jgi:hypothetical protein
MNVQIIRFLDIWLKRLCLKICNTAHCNKELVFHKIFPQWKGGNFDPVPRSEEPLIPSMSKIVW